jgi:hypothetical protein
LALQAFGRLAGAERQSDGAQHNKITHRSLP